MPSSLSDWLLVLVLGLLLVPWLSLARVMNEEEDNKRLRPPSIGSIAERRARERVRDRTKEERAFVQRSNRKEKLQLPGPVCKYKCNCNIDCNLVRRRASLLAMANWRGDLIHSRHRWHRSPHRSVQPHRPNGSCDLSFSLRVCEFVSL